MLFECKLPLSGGILCSRRSTFQALISRFMSYSGQPSPSHDLCSFHLGRSLGFHQERALLLPCQLDSEDADFCLPGFSVWCWLQRSPSASHGPGCVMESRPAMTALGPLVQSLGSGPRRVQGANTTVTLFGHSSTLLRTRPLLGGCMGNPMNYEDDRGVG